MFINVWYQMIFVPFTAWTNYMNSVMFVVALLSSEDVDSYTWLLEAFIKCLDRALGIVLTNEDTSLNVVIPKVILEMHHMLYMWHIMIKLFVKVR